MTNCFQAQKSFKVEVPGTTGTSGDFAKPGNCENEGKGGRELTGGGNGEPDNRGRDDKDTLLKNKSLAASQENAQPKMSPLTFKVKLSIQ